MAIYVEIGHYYGAALMTGFGRVLPAVVILQPDNDPPTCTMT